MGDLSRELLSQIGYDRWQKCFNCPIRNAHNTVSTFHQPPCAPQILLFSPSVRTPVYLYSKPPLRHIEINDVAAQNPLSVAAHPELF